ncbi:hypothetical protein QBC46DRAFT_160617 [Diplogelasinospora grovesii]|uniref:Uncharacterized protein n=1 Tax=Diplogelasinospora grovesii TaxID=303347 RepID=A0AAN6N4N8_9PEZI|nr:hypothetical protein QBC46DRAFT_160617 [Diplogelasinospora grovesii]
MPTSVGLLQVVPMGALCMHLFWGQTARRKPPEQNINGMWKVRLRRRLCRSPLSARGHDHAVNMVERAATGCATFIRVAHQDQDQMSPTQ